MTLKGKTQSALLWNALDGAGNQLIRFAIGIVLARLLMPSDYGLIGIIQIFVVISLVLLDSGFGQALVQKRGADHTDFSSVFFLNIGTGALMYALLWLTAPLISSYFREPELTILVRVVTISLLINSFGIVHNARITREIDFRSRAKASLISVLAGGSAGIILALTGFGVWSLVAQILIRDLVFTVFVWVLYRWWPSFTFSIHSVRQLFGYGSKLLLAGMLDQFFRNLYNLIIGRYFSTSDLGYYTRARGYNSLASENLTRVIQNVSFPVFSEIQDDNIRLKKGYRKVLGVTMFINVPLMVFMIVMAEPLIVFLISDKWLQTVPYLQILAISGLIYPMHAVNLNLLKVKGFTGLFLRLEILKKGLIIIAILISFQYGVMGLVVGQAIVSVLSYFINAFYSGRIISYSVIEQLRDILPFLMISIPVMLLLIFISRLYFLGYGGKIALGFVMSAILYYLFSIKFCSGELQEVKELVGRVVLSKSRK